MKDKIMGTKRWIFYVSIGIVLILVYKFLDNFSMIGTWIKNLFGILGPFIAAIFIAYVLYPPISGIEKFLKKKKIKFARVISISIVYIIVGIILIIALKFIIPAIIDSISDLVKNAQNYYNAITTSDFQGNIAPFIKDNILKPGVEFIQKFNFQEMFTLDKIKDYIDSAMGVAKALVNVFIAVICSIYILSQRESILKFIKKLAKASMHKKGYQKFDKYFSEGNKIFFKFISSQVIDGFVVAVIMSIALSIMNVKYAVLLGVMIGLFNLIPYFGAILAVIIAGLITILTGGWQLAIFTVIVTTVLQQIDANIINPKITGSRLNVSPLLVIFAVTVGGAYFGIVGMLLGVPIAVLIKLMIDDYIKNKEVQ